MSGIVGTVYVVCACIELGKELVSTDSQAVAAPHRQLVSTWRVFAHTPRRPWRLQHRGSQQCCEWLHQQLVISLLGVAVVATVAMAMAVTMCVAVAMAVTVAMAVAVTTATC